MISSPLGTAIGGPLVAGLGATGTLAASGVATIALAAAASVLWREGGEQAVDSHVRSIDAARSVHD